MNRHLLLSAIIFILCLGVGRELSAEEFKTREFGRLEICYTDKHTKLVEQTVWLVDDSLEELDAQLGLKLKGKLKLIIMPSRQAFEKYLNPQQRVWTLAFALIDRSAQSKGGTIVIEPSSLDLMVNTLWQTLKHELFHILIHESTDDIPKWFDEGVAQWVSEYSIFASKKNELRLASLSNRLIPLAELEADFPKSVPAVRLAYIQSESVVQYIIQQYGASSIRTIIQHLKNGADFETALTRSIKSSTTELEVTWRKQFRVSMFNLFMLLFTQRNIFIMIGLLAVLSFFIMRSRRKKRLQVMEEEDAWMQSLDKTEWGISEYEEDEDNPA